MQFPRAIRISLVTYIVTLVVSGVITILIGSPVTLDQGPTSDGILAAMIVAIVLVGFGAWWYFRPANVPGGFKNGLLFGILASGTAFVLDAVIALVLAATDRDAAVFLRDAYTHWFFWIMMVSGLSLTGIIGALKPPTQHP